MCLVHISLDGIRDNDMNALMHNSRALRKRTKRRDGVKLDLLERMSIPSSMQGVIQSK
jgi:hypothetical protein